MEDYEKKSTPFQDLFKGSNVAYSSFTARIWFKYSIFYNKMPPKVRKNFDIEKIDQGSFKYFAREQQRLWWSFKSRTCT